MNEEFLAGIVKTLRKASDEVLHKESELKTEVKSLES